MSRLFKRSQLNYTRISSHDIEDPSVEEKNDLKENESELSNERLQDVRLDDLNRCKVTLCLVGKPRREEEIDINWTVAQFKLELFPDDTKKLIRVIYAGKRLKDTDLLKDCGIKENVFIHISITNILPPALAQNVRPEHQTDDMDRDQEISDARFAAMLQNGLQPQDAAAMDQALEQRTQEQQRSRAYAEFIWGFVLGSVLGIFMLIWVVQRTVPNRMKLGIMCGICFHIYSDYNPFDH